MGDRRTRELAAHPALITARSLGDISRHWDAVYEAMRRAETDKETSSERDNAARKARRQAHSRSDAANE